MTHIYDDGTYLDNNPLWHQEDSQWKAQQIKKIIDKHKVKTNTVCEVGCGAGEVLNQLTQYYDIKNNFYGYDISPQAFELCKKKSKPNLIFYHQDLLKEKTVYFDIILAIDVFEHVEDYMGFLRKLKAKGEYKIFHVPLDLSVQTVLRSTPIINGRKSVGHIHYFTRDTAIETLKDTGYEILDYYYTNSSTDLPVNGWKANLLKFSRKLSFLFSQDLTVRILGGFSLLVLAK